MKRTAAVLVALLAAATGPAAQEASEFAGFPPAPGREEVVAWCTGCHGGQLVRNQALSRQRWAETLDFMTERHGMPDLDGAERAVILDYLAAQFGPRAASGRERPAPFLTRPRRANPFADP